MIDRAWAEDEAEERKVRLHVHVALASALVGFLAPVVGWALLLADRRARRGRWKRRLLALAVLDTLLALGLGLATASGLDVARATSEPPRIGVALAPAEHGRGVVVERVAEDGPAARASIRAGDRIVAIDGRAVTRAGALVTEMGETAKGASRHLTIERGDQALDVVVTPEVGAPAPKTPPGSLFEPNAREGSSAPAITRSFVGGAGIVTLALVGGLAIAARRRHARALPALAVAAGLLALTVATTAVLLAFQATVGLSLGALLVALLAGSVALLGTALAGILLIRPGPVRIGPAIGTGKAIGLGVFYAVTGAARVVAALGLLVTASGLPIRTAAQAFAFDLSSGPAGLSIFLAATVLVAPIAEELLFRGVLLPWLARWMKPAAALAWSTIVFSIGHLYYGLGALLIAYYGVVLGWARLRTGKLWAPVALHAMLNATTAIVILARGGA